MALFGIKVPQELGDLFEKFEVPGELEPKHKYHITMIYLGKEVAIEDVTRAAQVAFPVTSATKPFAVSTRLITTFPKNEDGIPVIAKIESPELHTLRQRITQALTEGGVKWNNKYPEYNPHMTLAYSEEPMADRVIPPITWTINEIVLWGGDEGEKRIVVRLPLEFNLKLARRVASRFQRA